MVPSAMPKTIKYFSRSLFILGLSVYGFFASEIGTQILFVISGLLGFANALYAVRQIKANTDRPRK